MPSQTALSVEREPAEAVKAVESCLHTASALLGGHVHEQGSQTPLAALTTARGALADAVTNGSLPESAIEDACAVLVQIEELEEHLARETAYVAFDLSSVHDVVAGLRDLPPRGIIHAAPAVLSKELSFTRAMISAVNGPLWQPQKLYVDPQFDGSPVDISDFVDSAAFPLSQARLETEVVRRKIPAFVPAPAHDDRTLAELVSVSRTSGYVAAPILSNGRVIGLLHADRPETDSALEPYDRDRLDAFATFLAIIYEQSVLRERLHNQRVRIGTSFAATESMLERLHCAELKLRHASELRRPSLVTRSDDTYATQIRATLTVREVEILEHLATGATNSEIARRLVISEGTVKSHVKHILKKLNVPTRAAAAVIYTSQHRR